MIAVAGCNHECITGTLTLHVAWSQPATTDEAISIRGTFRGGGDWTNWVPIAVGAVAKDVRIDASHVADDSSLGVSIYQGGVVIMSTVTDPIRDACGSLVVDSWDVDQGLPGRD